MLNSWVYQAKDNQYCAFYAYDGNGERTYKLTGTTSIDQYNAGEETFHKNFNDTVIYVNPYMILSDQGITKHYYNKQLAKQKIIMIVGYEIY